MKKKPIEIAICGIKKAGQQDVNAFIFGSFGVHMERREHWRVTHIPTGISMSKGYCLGKSKAIAYAKELSSIPDSDVGKFADFDSVPTILFDAMKVIYYKHMSNPV